jgi:hypothetical protein
MGEGMEGSLYVVIFFHDESPPDPFTALFHSQQNQRNDAWQSGWNFGNADRVGNRVTEGWWDCAEAGVACAGAIAWKRSGSAGIGGVSARNEV